MLAKNVRYYGSESPLPERYYLKAGPLQMVYEAGDLRAIKSGKREIVRRIYVAVRDRDWGTVPARLSQVQIQTGPDWFQISYQASHREETIDFTWKGTIRGTAEGTITFEMDGQALSSFLKSRIGFCVLHSIDECAGKVCTIEQSDGQTIQSRFPVRISPHQPFVNIQAMTYAVEPELRVKIQFTGDIFETEDQRNWTDGSYKTYGTPLSQPFPVEIQAGTQIAQSVRLSIEGRPAEPIPAHEERETVTVEIGEISSRVLPRIGLALAGHGQPLQTQELKRLQALKLSHLRVELDLTQNDYENTLLRAIDEARGLNIPLEIALTLSNAAEKELARLLEVLKGRQPDVHAWLIFHKNEASTRAEWITTARTYLATYQSTALIGSGASTNFTELNREHPPADLLDLVCYAINPQVHAFDNTSLVETLAIQAETLTSARVFAQGRPIAVTPITLQPRFHGSEAEEASEKQARGLPPQVDPRQMSLFGAGWTVGSLKYVAAGGAYSTTYYETSGWCGVMEQVSGSPMPEKFRSIPGSVFPLYHILADIGEFAGGRMIEVRSSQPLVVEGLAIYKDQKTRILLANMGETAPILTIQFANEAEHMCQINYLDEENVLDAMVKPETFRTHLSEDVVTSKGKLVLKLRPFAIIRIDF